MTERGSRTRPRRPRGPAHHTARRSSLVELLDDEVEEYSVSQWRSRNMRLVDALITLGLYDPSIISREAHAYVTESLIHVMNGAATDPQNGGHLRAQNENVVHYALAAHVPKRTLAIALEAGFIHDLNKAIGEPLRQDDYAVACADGGNLQVMTTMGQIVGLNHLGERTRSTLEAATRLSEGALSEDIFRAIDMCIVHHGLGSSRFIQELVDGKNPWWGDAFVDPKTRVRKIVHPKQPPWTLESAIHDLADSTQQMQGGAAWLMKYPAGFWRASGRSIAEMLSGGSRATEDPTVPLSLRLQIQVETETCRHILAQGMRAGVIDEKASAALTGAVHDAAESSLRWIDDSPEYLDDPEGASAYHDVARALGLTPEEARERLGRAIAGSPEAGALEPILWRSGRRLDLERARALAEKIELAAALS